MLGDVMNASQSLPDPDPAALERSRLLGARLRAAIAASADGVIGFDAFMSMALYEPGLGYYASGERIFGRGGDFVTAPEAGSLFAACLAEQCRELLGDDDVIVEYGGGSGRLAADLLGTLAARHAAPARYLMVEPSAGLVARQRARLANLAATCATRIEWYTDHPPAGCSGVVVANEVLDALPAQRFVVEEGRWREVVVGLDGEAFAWRSRDYDGALLDHAWAADLPDGYLTEVQPGLDAWLAALRARLAHGVVLLFDYGYPRHEYLHPARTRGTLQCHYRHHVHDDALRWPGLQDLTASVDFTRVAEAAFAAGFEVAGYTSQAQFLLHAGLEGLLAAAGDETERYRLAQQAKLLLLPGAMGQTFKCMALSVGAPPALRGFRHDERHRLEGFMP